jgi:hypothetical protein
MYGKNLTLEWQNSQIFSNQRNWEAYKKTAEESIPTKCYFQVFIAKSRKSDYLESKIDVEPQPQWAIASL